MKKISFLVAFFFTINIMSADQGTSKPISKCRSCGHMDHVRCFLSDNSSSRLYCVNCSSTSVGYYKHSADLSDGEGQMHCGKCECRLHILEAWVSSEEGAHE